MALLGGLIIWLALDTARNPEQLISLAGFCFLVLFLFACSKHHSAVCASDVSCHWCSHRMWPPSTEKNVLPSHWHPLMAHCWSSLEEAESSRAPGQSWISMWS